MDSSNGPARNGPGRVLASAGRSHRYGSAVPRTDWNPVLSAELAKPYWSELQRFVADERARHAVYPPADEVFAALHLTPYAAVKVLILGQDPYHGPGQAHGLCFSVRPGVPLPPSLRNIFKELERDLGAAPPPFPDPGGSLVKWAKNGVLLLNTCLTVEEGQPASHAGRGWEVLTDAVIRHVAQGERPLVFMLWGSHAQSKRSFIDGKRHKLLMSNHPSPLSAQRPPVPFIGCGHFGQARAWRDAQRALD